MLGSKDSAKWPGDQIARKRELRPLGFPVTVERRGIHRIYPLRLELVLPGLLPGGMLASETTGLGLGCCWGVGVQ